MSAFVVVIIWYEMVDRRSTESTISYPKKCYKQREEDLCPSEKCQFDLTVHKIISAPKRPVGPLRNEYHPAFLQWVLRCR